MKHIISIATLSSLLILGLSLNDQVAKAQTPVVDEQSTDAEEMQTRRQKRQDRRQGGAAAGALAGAALGSIISEAGAGAAYGAVAGSVYQYDQSRQDDRTQMLADSIAGSKASDIAPQETVGDVGKRRMQDFLGDWKLDAWVLTEDGNRLMGSGFATGVSAGENGTRIVYREFVAEDFPEATGGGYTLLSYDPGQGFFLESSFSFSDEVIKGVGEYLVDKNAYNFYLTSNTSGEMVTGMLRSSVRIEIRVSGSAMWVADTYTHIDNKGSAGTVLSLYKEMNAALLKWLNVSVGLFV